MNELSAYLLGLGIGLFVGVYAELWVAWVAVPTFCLGLLYHLARWHRGVADE